MCRHRFCFKKNGWFIPIHEFHESSLTWKIARKREREKMDDKTKVNQNDSEARKVNIFCSFLASTNFIRLMIHSLSAISIQMLLCWLKISNQVLIFTWQLQFFFLKRDFLCLKAPTEVIFKSRFQNRRPLTIRWIDKNKAQMSYQFDSTFLWLSV